MICGWLPSDRLASTSQTVAAMGRALRAHAGQSWGQFNLPGLGLGLLDVGGDNPSIDQQSAAAQGRDKRYSLWLSGEIFGGRLTDADVDAEYCRSERFRQKLLGAFIEHGPASLARLDGQYQVAVWDAVEEILTLCNDRFATMPLYWSASADGLAFAGGVRGVLMAPGVSSAPDLEAIQEAVTFGGFRLGDRTNVGAVKMLPMAGVLRVQRGGRPAIERYWHWSDIPPARPRPMPDLVDAAHALWQQAITRRLVGARRPGQTLSGGLDSRAILAEAAPRTGSWTAITYGVPGCDDARYAERAAALSNCTWLFHPLYSGTAPDWLERRTQLIQPTDGLIQLGDLMHFETLHLQAALVDVNLSGFIGDAACGPTFDGVKSPEDLVIKMPYYGADLSWQWPKAVDWGRRAIEALGGAPARFALYDHKIAQSTNYLCSTPAMWMKVRRPFLDYALFDFFNGQPAAVRQTLYWRLLRTKYPAHFVRIANQATGTPVLSPRWQVELARARRVSWRLLQPRLQRIGLPARPRIRGYMADELHWSAPSARRQIEDTVLRRQSLVCDVFGRERVQSTLRQWFDHGAAPCQLIGALYVYEAYHRDLAATLQSAARPVSTDSESSMAQFQENGACDVQAVTSLED